MKQTATLSNDVVTDAREEIQQYRRKDNYTQQLTRISIKDAN